MKTFVLKKDETFNKILY